MPRGGKREGAGRKPGAAHAGKAPRDPTLRRLARARVREVLSTANDPLAVLVEIASDPKHDVQVRVQAASSACPFLFPRLSATVVASVPVATRDEHGALVERLLTRFQRIAETGQAIEAEPLETAA